MSEAEFQQIVTDLCDWLRLLWYHTHDSRRSPAGFLDLCIVGPNEVIFAELKSVKGKLTADQKKWIDALHRAGVKAYVWRPDDIYEVKAILTKLAKGTLRS